MTINSVIHGHAVAFQGSSFNTPVSSALGIRRAGVPHMPILQGARALDAAPFGARGVRANSL